MAQPALKTPDQISQPVSPGALKKAPLALNEGRMNEYSFKHTVYAVDVPVNVSVEDILVPEYWRNVGEKLKPFDEIKVVAEDGSWYAWLLVLSAARLWAKVALIVHQDLKEARKDMPLTDDENHEVKWKGPTQKYVVTRKSDGASLKEGFQTQLEGWQWLDGHLKSLRQ